MFLNFRAGELLQRRYEKLGKNWYAVERDMQAKVDEGKDAKPLSRKRLAAMARGDDTVTLTIAELRRLQKYLVVTGMVKFDENAFFSPPTNLLDALRGESKITVFYPSRKLQNFHTEGASRWDLRAIEALNSASEINSLRFSFQDVYNLGSKLKDPKQLVQFQATRRWHRVLDEDRALISIGAPFSCYASEIMLCRMFNVPPYKRQGLKTDRRLPFYLYWPNNNDNSDSAFAVTREELQRRYPEQLAQMDPDDRAVLIGGKLYPAPMFGESMNLIVAQYWRGHLAMVLLGVYAPSTLTIAELLAAGKVTESLGPYRYTRSATDLPWESQPVLISKIKTTISRASSGQTDPFPEDIDERRPAGVEAVGWERWQWGGDKFVLRGSGGFEEVPDNVK